MTLNNKIRNKIALLGPMEFSIKLHTIKLLHCTIKFERYSVYTEGSAFFVC